MARVRPKAKTRKPATMPKREGRTVKNKVLVLVLLVFGLWLVYHPVKNMVVTKMVKYGTAEWKVLEQSEPVAAALIRDETVVAAPADGTFEPAVPEGEKVAVGRVIGYVQTQAATSSSDLVKIAVKAPRAGLVSYHPDDLEGVLKPDMLDKLDIEKISQLLADKQGGVSAPPKAERGKPLLKIVDNLANPYVYLPYPAGLTPVPVKGKSMTVKFSDGIKTEIVFREVKKSNDQLVAIGEILDAPDLDLKNRFMTLNIIAGSYEGVTIAKEALVEKDGRPGVFMDREGVCRWTEVEVKGSVKDQVVVSGLDVGSRYILNTSWVREGQRLD
ncbi:HlyD family efflux transporter periplasmic adaptor subunit [Candidatus Formimonas warabiya]|uniref:RND related barrel-sandwich hybrid domain-containing protein n=1 Tax=Formimonas warabiya TaxID=1761012 RepID=A0A3G1KR52_FORW1|nr:HlyD family efflux transporter periplasmic adaptor subunit [Candidatus Formimonas warabiya]ATW24949.1 hypothetical protein DCMF_09345 [Candidatus Formimonas warabiya]